MLQFSDKISGVKIMGVKYVNFAPKFPQNGFST